MICCQKLLLLSSSRYRDTGYLEHALAQIRSFLPEGIDNLLFVPFANVTINFDAYEDQLAKALAPLKIAVRSIHRADDLPAAVSQAQAIAVGGGNTFALLKRLQDAELLKPIRAAVEAGTPYIGWSAGSNVAGRTIRTTNDMPICQPASFEALSLIPFQLNPHFISGKIKGHNGESREERLAEFLAFNPQESVLALPEGSLLARNGNMLNLRGAADAVFLTAGKTQTIERNTDLSWLLRHIGET